MPCHSWDRYDAPHAAIQKLIETYPFIYQNRSCWIVTNPTFRLAFEITQSALQHSNIGVALLLRCTCLEPCKIDAGYKSIPPIFYHDRAFHVRRMPNLVLSRPGGLFGCMGSKERSWASQALARKFHNYHSLFYLPTKEGTFNLRDSILLKQKEFLRLTKEKSNENDTKKSQNCYLRASAFVLKSTFAQRAEKSTGIKKNSTPGKLGSKQSIFVPF